MAQYQIPASRKIRRSGDTRAQWFTVERAMVWNINLSLAARGLMVYLDSKSQLAGKPIDISALAKANRMTESEIISLAEELVAQGDLERVPEE